MINKINLIECNTTWQGEGVDCGKQMLLLRFKYCNKKCAWCDTNVKMRTGQEFEFPLDRIQGIIFKDKVGLLITGGEPTFGKQFDQTVAILNQLSYPYANVESNGLRLAELMQQANVPAKFIYSPKIFTEKDYDQEVENIKKFYSDPRLFVKIVYEANDLIQEYLDFLDKLNIHHRVFLMPKGITREELLKNAPEVFDIAEKHRFGFSSRTHIIYNFI